VGPTFDICERERFGFAVETAGLAAGGISAAICRRLEDCELYGVIDYRRPNHEKGYFFIGAYRLAHGFCSIVTANVYDLPINIE